MKLIIFCRCNYLCGDKLGSEIRVGKVVGIVFNRSYEMSWCCCAIATNFAHMATN